MTCKHCAELEAENARLRDGLSRQQSDIQQTLGKALGYSWYKNDPKAFPGATDGVCVGEHTAESLADEAARTITRLINEVAYWQEIHGPRVEGFGPKGKA